MDIRGAIEQTRQTHYPHIEAILEEVVVQQHGRGHLLNEMCQYHLGTGGKRLRAVLPCLLAEALDAAVEPLYPFAAACEMLHNATLVHDDLQDGDHARRGHPTVWARYSPAQAINLGDGMYFYAVLCLERLAVPVDLKWALTQDLLQGAAQVIDGQVREFALQDLDRPSSDDYVAMVERKTSALFALPLTGAARLANAHEELRQTLALAATHLGVIFQLQDDVLDLYGDKGRAERGSDIREGKISGLVVHALARSSSDDAHRLRELLRVPREETPGDAVAWAIDHIEACGALGDALAEIRRREEIVATLPGLTSWPDVHTLVSQLTRAFLAPISHLLNAPERTP